MSQKTCPIQANLVKYDSGPLSLAFFCEIKNKKFKMELILEVFHSLEEREKKKFQILIFGYFCIAIVWRDD